MSGELYVQLNINHSYGELPNQLYFMMWSLIDHCFLLHIEMCKMALHVSSFSSRFVSCCPAPPVSQADSREITQAVRLLRAAQRPLIIIGKGEQNRTEWPRVMASSQLKLIKAMLNCDLLQVRRMPGQRRRSGSWWRWLGSLSFPHLWGKEYCRMTILTVLLRPGPGVHMYQNDLSKISFWWTGVMPVSLFKSFIAGWCYSVAGCQTQLDPALWFSTQIQSPCEDHSG